MDFLLNPVTILIVLNVLIFLSPYVLDFSKSGLTSQESLLELGWKENFSIKNGEYYRLLTSIFLHGDALHLLSNMWALWIFGSSFSSLPLLFVAIYFASGLVGSLFSFFFNPHPSIGASGAIFGLVGALLAIGINSNFSSNLVSNLLVYIVLSFMLSALPGTRIDLWGHLGGLTGGFIIGFILN